MNNAQRNGDIERFLQAPFPPWLIDGAISQANLPALEADSGEMLRTYHTARCGHSDVYGAGCRQFIYPHHAKLIVGDSERLNT